MNDEAQQIEAFLERFCLCGGGGVCDRSKYGNKILRCYLQHGRQAIPVNPSSPGDRGRAMFRDAL